MFCSHDLSFYSVQGCQTHNLNLFWLFLSTINNINKGGLNLQTSNEKLCKDYFVRTLGAEAANLIWFWLKKEWDHSQTWKFNK